MTKADTINFFLTHIQYDVDFVEPLYERYGDTMRKIAETFKKNDRLAMPLLSTPNEVCEFLDGNGFTVEYNNNEVTIKIITHKYKFKTGGPTSIYWGPDCTGTVCTSSVFTKFPTCSQPTVTYNISSEDLKRVEQLLREKVEELYQINFKAREETV